MKTDPFTSPDDYNGIHFFNTSGTSLPVDADTAHEIAACIEDHDSCTFKFIEIAFVDTNEIKRINNEHLDHDYITDIITFRYDENQGKQSVEGTLYCCAQRIQEQAREFSESPKDEFKRLIIHGLLHLIGYDDQSETDKKQMREREDFYLQKLP